MKFLILICLGLAGVSVAEAGPCPEAEQYIEVSVTNDGREARSVTNREAYDAAREKCRLDAMAARMAATQAAAGNPDVTTQRDNRMAVKCETFSTSRGSLEVCETAPGGGGVVDRVYKLNGREFDGKIRKNADGTYSFTDDSELSATLSRPTYRGPHLPGEFNCKNNNQEFQCLVCSCFFEARGQTFPERVRVSRTKFSRVLNNNFPNDVCSVVHHRPPPRRVPQYSWVSEHSSNKIFRTASGATKLPVNVTLGENSSDLDGPNKRSYRGCVQAANESLQYRNTYFASYYWTKNIEGTKQWMRDCDANTAHISGNIIRSTEDANGSELVFAHNFRRICRTNEEHLLGVAQSPYAPYRSTVTPRLRSTSPGAVD